MSTSEKSLDDGKKQAQACIRSNQLKQAEQLLSHLCDDYEADIEIRCLLANVHGLLGDNAAAEHVARSALDLNSEQPEPWSILGMALMAQENYPAALEVFRNVVQRDATDARAHYNLGKILSHMSAYTEAIPHFQQAVTLQSDYPELHLDLGLSCYRAGDFPQAETILAVASGQFPLNPDLHYWYARALQAAGDNERAMSSYETAVHLLPDMANAHAALASLCQQAGNTAAALVHYEKALGLKPDSAEIHYNHGTLLQAEERFVEAEAAYRKTLDLNSGLLEAWNNLGLSLQEQGRLDEALHCFDHAIGMCPSDTGQPNNTLGEVHWHRALLLLLMGDFKNGWPEYEWRRADPGAVTRSFQQPVWDGRSLADKTILVYAEQGVGDEVMFASCLPDLLGKAERVILESESRLVPLFSRSFPKLTVYPGPLKGDVPQADVQIAMGSLPLYLRTSPGDYSGGYNYLLPDPAALGKWEERYQQLGKGLKVGISWRGGRASQSRKRSTSLSEWSGLLQLESVHFVNLQYGDCAAGIEQVYRDYGVRIHDWNDADPLSDLDDFSAQVAALDLVVSVDNATVHIAAALGIPIWILQPFAPEWRWLAEGEGSYWYPEVRQFRQAALNDWSTVFVQVAAELELLLAQ